MTPDVNVLIAASRADHPHHRIAFDWLDQALRGSASGESFKVLPMVAAGFLRLVTNARVFRDPTPITNAVAFLEAIFNVKNVEIATCGAEWPIFRAICIDHELSDNDIPDAWIAAAVKNRNERLATFDRGFVRLLDPAELILLTP